MHKKSILFVVDKPDWAYEFMVKSWMPYLWEDYDCYLIYQQDYAIKPNEGKTALGRIFFNFISTIVFFLKKILNKDGYRYFLKKNYYYRKFNQNPIYQFVSENGDKQKLKNVPTEFSVKIEMAYYFQYTAEIPFSAKKSIVGIFTDAFPHDGPDIDLKDNTNRTELNRKAFFEKYLQDYDHVIVGGGNLENDYLKLTDKVSFVYGIFGEENFQFNPNVGEKDYLTIGWTGTPDRPMKGFRSIIEPAIENVKKSGRDVRLKTKFSGAYEELYTFYNDVDLIVIASSADSGPSLFAEASLSNVPTISTKVGLPLMGITHNVNGLFIERNIESLENAMIELYDNRHKLKSFSQRIKSDYLDKLGNEKSVQNILKILKD